MTLLCGEDLRKMLFILACMYLDLQECLIIGETLLKSLLRATLYSLCNYMPPHIYSFFVKHKITLS